MSKRIKRVIDVGVISVPKRYHRKQQIRSHGPYLHPAQPLFRHHHMHASGKLNRGHPTPNRTFITLSSTSLTPLSHITPLSSPPMAVAHLLLAAAVLAALAPASEASNITAILDGFPDYSLYNKYLTETHVADEINAHETITCLVLPNAAMATLTANHTIAGIKNALRLLTLLDYFDAPKIHSLPSGTTLTTTLLQTTGNVPGNSGFVNITNLRGGRVAFGPAASGAKLDADFTKSVKQFPYNISILEVSAPIVFPGLLDVPDASSTNLTAVLEKAGCKTFAGLLISSGVLKMYQSAMDKGLTVLAPNDEAFKAAGVPDLTTLTSADLVTLLQYHALASYTPKDALPAAGSHGTGIRTLASTGNAKFEISATSHGDDVSLDTGVDTSRVASMVLDSTPVCVLTIDSVLLPEELFGKAPSPAPGPAPFAAPVPAPLPLAPAPVEAPGPMPLSPPAPPTATPGGAPAAAPGVEDQKADAAAAAVGMKPLGAAALAATMAVAYWFVASVL